jgi:hypothetical protein
MTHDISLYIDFARANPDLFDQFVRNSAAVEAQRRAAENAQRDTLIQSYTFEHGILPPKLRTYYVDPQWLRHPHLLLDCVIRAFGTLLTAAGETPITCKQANDIPEQVDMNLWAYNPYHYIAHLAALLRQIRWSPKAQALWANVYGCATTDAPTLVDPKPAVGAMAQIAFFNQAAATVNARAVAVARIASAWKRAYYTPTYALCRRRILREFGELAGDLRTNGWAKK